MSVTWAPSEQFALEYLNAGGDTGVPSLVSAIVTQGVREWAAGVDWVDALYSTQDASTSILNGIKGIGPEVGEAQRGQGGREVGGHTLPALGVKFHRINILELKPRGDLAKLAEATANMKIVTDVAVQLGIPINAAIELLQVKLGSIEKTIRQLRADVSQETLVS